MGYNPCMLVEQNGRAIMSCDRCPIRLDIGIYQAVVNRPSERMPSMWVKSARDQHLCPQCATQEMRRMGLRP